MNAYTFGLRFGKLRCPEDFHGKTGHPFWLGDFKGEPFPKKGCPAAMGKKGSLFWLVDFKEEPFQKKGEKGHHWATPFSRGHSPILSRDPFFRNTIRTPAKTAGFGKEPWLRRTGNEPLASVLESQAWGIWHPDRKIAPFLSQPTNHGYPPKRNAPLLKHLGPARVANRTSDEANTECPSWFSAGKLGIGFQRSPLNPRGRGILFTKS